MARIQIDIFGDYSYNIEAEPLGEYSLTEDEFADFMEVQRRYDDWQEKLRELKPDGWVAPPPPKPRTPLEREMDNALYESQKEVNLSAFLDQHFPIK